MLPPIYPSEAVQPFRDELNVVGLKDLLTPEEVDKAVKSGGTTFCCASSFCAGVPSGTGRWPVSAW